MLAAQLLAQQVKAAGITVNVRKIEPTDFFGPNYLKWTFAQDFYYYSPYLLQVTDSFLPTSPYNETHFNDPTTPALQPGPGDDDPGSTDADRAGDDGDRLRVRRLHHPVLRASDRRAFAEADGTHPGEEWCSAPQPGVQELMVLCLRASQPRPARNCIGRYLWNEQGEVSMPGPDESGSTQTDIAVAVKAPSSPRPIYDQPTHIRYQDVTQHLWGDETSGEVADWIYVSSQKVHHLVFGLPPGGVFKHSDTFRTVFAADEVLYVLSGLLSWRIRKLVRCIVSRPATRSSSGATRGITPSASGRRHCKCSSSSHLRRLLVRPVPMPGRRRTCLSAAIPDSRWVRKMAHGKGGAERLPDSVARSAG